MGLFKRKEKIIDLSGYKLQEKKIVPKKEDTSSNLEFLGNLAGSNSSSNSYVDMGEGEKKNKLAKRLLDMTNKIEDLSNQIYHLKQRIELLERKLKVSFE
jgi:NAD+--asparagine ADP-ribosyltransferase